MIQETQELIPRQTLAQMTGAYALACDEIKQACGLMKQARERLESAFGSDHYKFRYPQNAGPEDGDEILAEFKRDAWRNMVGRLELRRLMSVKRSKELDEQLDERASYRYTSNGRSQIEPLPDLTFENVVAMLESTATQVKDFLLEAVDEVFEFLRPHRNQYKTNSEFEIGRKVIKGWWVRHGYNGCYQVNYDRQAEVTALDNVFHLLDGKGPIKTHHGPLSDAIGKTTYAEGKGETEYFRFKCFGNCNLHLEFKRLDLLAKLNKIAGGNRLKPKNQ